ncbi:TRAP transporter permease [Microbacterium sp. APC 3898]|uniref:TRAP transporter permease n=2 Tax=Planococcus TaxID=1372 RepID=A0ABT7ZFP2_9BACL|nr:MULTISPECIES: TRAP transporter permease [Terrabacteria group]MBD8013662.1 TRAP transporter permease [Planococcus wigleyi]MBF6633063.1 TRAP transporter permease [Planococcus sp. (in: firmicutes)]MDN3425965.1 TRAP transporter permease [Planococcus sp. APC 4016]MDN3497662.1 TRAP transporter permease [Microbacterium sp. APC 3898]
MSDKLSPEEREQQKLPPEDESYISEEKQKEILQKYDPESNTRDLSGIIKHVVFFGLLAFSLFQLYTAIFGQYTAYIQRSVHLGFALSLIFILFPARKRKGIRHKVAWYDYILALLSIGVAAYWPIMYDDLVFRLGRVTELDLIVGILAILLTLEATRRAVGMPITVIASLFLAYAFFGPYFPSFLRHRGQDLDSIVQLMFYTTDGILGTPISVSATFIFTFLLFGSFLVKTGVGQYFNDLAVSLAGHLTGGPAKVAIFSSALQGTISGSSVANVVTSGSYTIPMMKKLGYKKEFAGGVEAAASTGGQLMPPIMGAAAFLMVEFIGGVTYWEIAKAAAIPALLYFTGVWIMTHFEAKRIGLKGLSPEEMPNRKEVLKKIYLLLPIIAIIVFLLIGIPTMQAALYGILLTIFVSAFNKETRLNFKDIILALVDGARTALAVAAATAAAGIIVGVVVKTGLGLSLANGLVSASGGNILLTLFFTMLAAIVLGMGSPTTANYVITSTIAAPAIITLLMMDEPVGAAVPLVVALSAHLFVFYFGIIADITPPVALAAFAASGISGGEPIKTGFIAAKLAAAAFIIPYMFVLSPALLMIDTTWPELIWVLITALTGMIAIGAGLIGYWYRKLNWLERILAFATGLALIYPEGLSDTIGAIAFVILFGIQWLARDKKPAKTVEA